MLHCAALHCQHHPLDLNRDWWEDRVLAARTLFYMKPNNGSNGAHDKMEWNIIKWTILYIYATQTLYSSDPRAETIN